MMKTHLKFDRKQRLISLRALKKGDVFILEGKYYLHVGKTTPYGRRFMVLPLDSTNTLGGWVLDPEQYKGSNGRVELLGKASFITVEVV